MPEHSPFAIDPITRRRFVQVGAGTAGALALGGALSACGSSDSGSDANDSEATEGGDLTIAYGDALSSDSPDPATAFTIFSLSYSGMVFDSLVALSQKWDISPMLAEDYDVASDFLTYTFKLKDGIEFHDGKPLDADDVVFSFQRIFDPKVGAAGLSQFEPVLEAKGVSAKDKSTVEFSLKRPDAYFLIKVGFWYGKIVPAGTTDFSASKGSFGTGAFKVKSFKGGEGFQLERNENYWQDNRPYLDTVTGQVILDPTTRTEAVLSGDADLADPTSFESVDQVNNSGIATFEESPFGPAFVFGIDGSTEPFKDPNIARAAKAATDRQALIDIAARGYGTISPDSIVNPNEPYWPGGIEPAPYDPELARSLLDDSGFSGDITIWGTSSLRALGDGATLLSEQWNEAGFNSEPKDVPFDDLFGKRFLQEKVVANYWLRQHFSTEFPFMYKSSGPYNEARINDPQLDKLIEQLERTPLDDGGEEILKEILSTYNEKAAAIWPFHMKDLWPRKNRVGGLALDPTEIVNVRNAYISES